MKINNKLTKKEPKEKVYLICPFCGKRIKGRLPENLKIKNMIGIINTIIKATNENR